MDLLLKQIPHFEPDVNLFPELNLCQAHEWYYGYLTGSPDVPTIEIQKLSFSQNRSPILCHQEDC